MIMTFDDIKEAAIQNRLDDVCGIANWYNEFNEFKEDYYEFI